MNRYCRALIAITIAVLATAAALIAAPAQAATGGQASACRNIQITGGRVAVREFAFTNDTVLRVRTRGAVLRSCGFVSGNGSNGYANKCGFTGRSWFQVNIPATRNPLGLTVTKGFVPATCARVL